MNQRLFILLMAGTLAILLIGGVAIVAILSSSDDQKPAPTRHFLTEYHIEEAEPLNAPGTALDFGKPSDGGALPAPCYPLLPPTMQYTFWNPDPADARTLLAPYAHAYNTETFSTGERVHISVYRPDKSIYLQQTVTAPVDPLSADCFSHETAVGLSWIFSPTDPAGEWRVQMRSDAGKSISYTTQLQAPPSPWISRYCEDSRYQLMLAGFRSREQVTLALVEAGAVILDSDQHRTAPTTILSQWAIQMDHQGELRLTFADSIEPADQRYFLVTDSAGRVIGTDQAGQVVSLNRYQACSADPFSESVSIPISPLTPDAVGITLEISPTFTLSVNCTDAPPPRFAIGDTAVVDFKTLGALRIMRHPDSPTEEEVTLAQAYDADHLLILAGPVCGVNRDRWMWRVRLERNNYEGWASEGITGDNWMCPLSDPECGS